MVWNPEVTTWIGSLPEIQSISARRTELIAERGDERADPCLHDEAAMITPMAAPATNVRPSAKGTPNDLSAISHATTTAPTPTSVPTARSMTPADRGHDHGHGHDR